MLDPVHLRTLRRVVTTGSFALAAAALDYTPSAVSQQMSALERTAGVALFERLPRGITPTPAAHQLAARAADILAELDAAEAELATLARGRSGRLRLGAFPTAGAALVPAALAQLEPAAAREGVSLSEAEPDQLEAEVMTGDLDLALLYRYDLVPRPEDERLVVTRLRREAMLLLLPASRPAARSDRPIRLARLRDERWVAPLVGSAGAENLERLCAAAGFRPRVSFRSNDYAVVRGLVAAGLGVALVPELALDPVALSSKTGVHASAVWGHHEGREVLAVHRRTDRNPLIPALLGALQAIRR
ncbi:MAG: LysR family transcriptional regulator [bacterium]